MYSKIVNLVIIMERATDRNSFKTKRFVMLTVAAVMLVMLVLTFLICCYALKAESHVRYVSILNVASERIAKTIRGMEMSAKNIFDEVQQHLDSPDGYQRLFRCFRTQLFPPEKQILPALHLQRREQRAVCGESGGIRRRGLYEV